MDERKRQQEKKIFLSGIQEAVAEPCVCCGCFFHLAGGEPKKSLHERGKREETSTPVLAPGAPPPFSNHNPPSPRGRCGKDRETKGGEKGRGRKRLLGRFPGLQQLSEVELSFY